MATKIFVNLPVKNLNKSIDFFRKLGFSFNPQFTDEKAACMIINEDAYVMLLTEPFFKTFTHKHIIDATKNTEVLVSLSAESKEKVNELHKKALSIGASEIGKPQEFGYMYGRSFTDIDGHIWEIIWMDVEAMLREQQLTKSKITSPSS